MTTTRIRERATEIHPVGLVEHAEYSEMPRGERVRNRLISKLLCAFFIAMAVTWIVTTIAGISR